LVKLSKIEWKTGIASFLFHISVRQFSRIEWKTGHNFFLVSYISTPIFQDWVEIHVLQRFYMSDYFLSD